MPYFSRLTDIVTCNLTAMLDAADDPAAALEQILAEMDQGLVASQRSVKTARLNVEQIERDIERQRREVDHWVGEARQQIQASNEPAARSALMRKKEAESLIEGLNQQLGAAVATRDQLTTTYHALHARLADAKRKQAELSGKPSEAELPPPDDLSDAIDAELAALRSEMQADS